MEKCISIAKPFTLIICFIDITSKCVFNQGTFSQSRHEKSNCEAVLGEESVVVFFISLCDFTVSVNLQILRLLFLGSRASSSPDSTPQKTWAQPAGLLQLLLFFCTLLFNVKKKNTVYMEIVVVVVKAYAPSFCFQGYDVLEHWINIRTTWESGDVLRRRGWW